MPRPRNPIRACTRWVPRTPAVDGRPRETMIRGISSSSPSPCLHERAGAVEPVPRMWYDPLRRQRQPWAQAHPPPRGPVERSRAMAFLPSMPDADMKDTLTREPAIGIPFSQLNEAVMRGDAPFSAGERELLAAYVSALNGCDYCQCVTLHTKRRCFLQISWRSQ